ncbi:4-hydroxy-3-methylbut-2-enyl diphosphate reductase [compost metagenome]
MLFEVCRKTNPNTFFISSVDEIDSSLFFPGESVGIAGATSTPMWLMEDVKHALEAL